MGHLHQQYRRLLLVLFVTFVGVAIYASVTGDAVLQSQLPALVMVLAIAVGGEPFTRSDAHRYNTYMGILTLLAGVAGLAVAAVGGNPLTNPILVIGLVLGSLGTANEYGDSPIPESPKQGTDATER